MKNIIRIFGIIAFTAVIVFTMTAAACGKGGSGSVSSGDGSGSGNVDGTLTINNLPGIGSVGLFPEVYNVSTMPTTKGVYESSIDTDNNIAYGKDWVKTPPYSPIALLSSPLVPFTQSGNFLVRIYLDADPGGYIERFTVTQFTNGSAAVNWNAMTDRNSLPD